MNKFLQKITVAVLIFTGFSLSAQNVGINATGAAPNGDALLDINSTNKGLLIPRVSIPNLTLIGPITGGATTSLLVYNTNAGTGLGYHYWDGADWIPFLTGASVDNGLYFNTGAARVRLGGPLVENTTITQGGFQMTYNLNGTGDFNVQDNGTTRFQVLDNGRIEMSGTTDASGATNTGVLEIGNALRIDNNEIITNTNSTLFLQNDNNGDLRVDNTTLAVDASTNRVGVGVTAPTQALHVVGNVRHSGALMPNNQAGTANQILMSSGAGAAPAWTNFILLNNPATNAMGKFFSGLFNIPTGQFTLTLGDANCVVSSTCSFTWVGNLPFAGPGNPNYGRDLLVTYEAQAGQWVFYIQNNTGFNLNNFQFSYFAAY